MSYSKTTWAQGDKITSTLLNKIEQGISDSEAMIVTLTLSDPSNNTYTADTEANDIVAAFEANKLVFVKIGTSLLLVKNVTETNMGGTVTLWISADDESIIGMGTSYTCSKKTATYFNGIWTYSTMTYQWSDATPYAVNGTFSTNAQEKKVITLTTTNASFLYTACQGGRPIKLTAILEEGVTGTYVLPCSCAMFTSGNTSTYKFRVINEIGEAYSSQALEANGSVVLTEE